MTKKEETQFKTRMEEIQFLLENSLSLERDLERLGVLMNDESDDSLF